MIDLSPEIVAILMSAGLLLVIFTGYPLAIGIGIVPLVVGYLAFGTSVVPLMYSQVFHILHNYILLAVPLFIFMGNMLGRSGIAERMYDALYLWFSGFRGGLAIVTVLLGTILAACVGVLAASVTMLTAVALPAMMKRGYDKGLASGAICAGGSLGILIPPSVMLVIYGPMAQISVGKLFMGAMLPGLLLSLLYCTYIALRSLFQPKIAPPVPTEERAAISFTRKTVMLMIAVFPTVFIILSVLGTIFLGIAPPTEAAAIGALAATILAIAYRKFSWEVLKDVALQTLKLTSMVMLIGGLAVAYTGVFLSAGAGKVVEAIVLAAPGGRWGAFAVVMFIYFIMGFFIEWLGILFIMVPILAPIAPILGFDPVWFGMMICVNLQMSFLTPPFAFAIFVIRGVAPPEFGLTTADIIRGVIPFVILIMIALVLCAVFPEIILWLPSIMIK